MVAWTGFHHLLGIATFPNAGEQSVALAVESKTAITLGHPVEVLGLQCGKRVDARWAYLAEGVDSFYRAEPVECEKGFIGANAE